MASTQTSLPRKPYGPVTDAPVFKDHLLVRLSVVAVTKNSIGSGKHRPTAEQAVRQTTRVFCPIRPIGVSSFQIKP